MMENNNNNATPVYCNAWGLASKGQLGCAFHSTKSLNALKIPNI
jgi:hypothetical protein